MLLLINYCSFRSHSRACSGAGISGKPGKLAKFGKFHPENLVRTLHRHESGIGIESTERLREISNDSDCSEQP